MLFRAFLRGPRSRLLSARGAILSAGAIVAGAMLLARAAPAAPATQVRILGGDHVKIPIDMRSHHVAVRGRVNGSDSVWVVIDTGASSSALDQGFVRGLGLRTFGQHEAMGAGGPVPGISVADVTIDLPGLRIHRDAMDAIEMASLGAQAGRRLDVIVGSELFMHNIVVMDYEAGVMEVWDPAAFRWPKGGTVVRMTLIENHPYVEGTITLPGRAPLAGRFVIDTGSSAALILSPATVERERVAAAFPRKLEAVGRGVGGELKNTIGRAESFSLGAARIEAPIVVCPSAGAGYISAPGTVGNIGGQVLSRFRVTFDYGHRRIGLESNRSRSNPFEADMTGAGITYAAELGVARVTSVPPGTPAAEAGIQPGDLIESLEDVGIAELTYGEFRERLKQDGREVRLGVRRGDQALSIKLRLRRQI